MPSTTSPKAAGVISGMAWSPPSFAPLFKMRPLSAESGVVAVTGIPERTVAVDVEHPAGHIAEQLLEVAFLPRLADTAGKQAVAGGSMSVRNIEWLRNLTPERLGSVANLPSSKLEGEGFMTPPHTPFDVWATNSEQRGIR